MSYFDRASPSRQEAVSRLSLESIGDIGPHETAPSLKAESKKMRSPTLAQAPVVKVPAVPAMTVTVAEPVLHKTTTFMSAKKFDVMAKFLHQKLAQNRWLEEYHENMWYGTSNLGTFVRKPDGAYAKTTHNAGVLRVVELIAAPIAFTMSCDTVSVLLDGLPPTQAMINFMDGSGLAVADTVDHIKDVRAYTHTGLYACLCRREHFVIIAASSPPDLLTHAASLEANMVGTIWGSSVTAAIPSVMRSSSMPQMHAEPDLADFSFGGAPNVRLSVAPAIRSHERRMSAVSASPLRSPSYVTPPRKPPARSLSMYQMQPYGRSGSEVDLRAMRSPRHHRRSSSAVSRTHSIAASEKAPRTSIESVPEDDVPEMQAFPRRSSNVNRSSSFSSMRMSGDYRGSISMDIASKIEFVEKAMEIEESGEHGDVEVQRDQPRPFLLVHACLVALALVLVVTLALWSCAKLLTETRLDGNYTRWLLVLTIPLFSIFALFFAIVISGSLFQLFGPMSFLTKNSFYYSAKAPKFSEHVGEELPHITIQMPVYKEGLKGVIQPTITSVLAAVKYYQAKGGTATIFVCEDGMQVISPELQEARKVFYELHNVAWCARPKQNSTPGPDYYLRRGKFKKASNMNYCLDFSLRVEDEWLRLMDKYAKDRAMLPEDFSPEEEDDILEEARNNIEELDGGKTWSAGDIRIGELILIIDSDTRVPEDCLLCGALEMIESPDVAIIQHGSGVMNMTGNPFENGIEYFTNLVYLSIAHAVASGDVAPFVGHNAFLRWKAIQAIQFQQDGKTKFWSEEHVSEDFDVSLRLQIEGFRVRMAGYHKGGFKEGVSLTVHDELARWEKYAYGCNELIFHPIRYWPTRGIITPLFKRFLFSPIKPTSKVTICAYIGTYYAIAVGFPLTVMNYFIMGLEIRLDHFYQSSWKIFVGLCVVYNILSPIAFAMLRYRVGSASYWRAAWDCIRHMPLFMLFFGGISFSLGKTLACHFLSIDQEWGATAKELTKHGFKVGLDRIVRDYWKMYLVMFAIIGTMVYFSFYAPFGYQIHDFTVLVPLVNVVVAHILLPFVVGLF